MIRRHKDKCTGVISLCSLKESLLHEPWGSLLGDWRVFSSPACISRSAGRLVAWEYTSKVTLSKAPNCLKNSLMMRQNHHCNFSTQRFLWIFFFVHSDLWVSVCVCTDELYQRTKSISFDCGTLLRSPRSSGTMKTKMPGFKEKSLKTFSKAFHNLWKEIKHFQFKAA